MNSKLKLSPDEIWQCIIDEAKVSAIAEPNFAEYFANTILNYEDLGSALSNHLAKKTSKCCRDLANAKRYHANHICR